MILQSSLHTWNTKRFSPSGLLQGISIPNVGNYALKNKLKINLDIIHPFWHNSSHD